MTTINTAKLEKAAAQARKSATELRGYADVLQKRISDKMNNYSGPRNENTANVCGQTNAKKGLLRGKADAFQSYNAAVTAFRSDVICKEDGLRAKIARLFGEFGNRHGINTEKTALDNIIDFAAGCVGIDGFKVRNFFGKTRDLAKAFRERIKNWYRAEGGREIIKAIGAVLLAVVTVIGAIAAILGGGVIMGIIAAVAAVCAFANAAVQMAHVAKAMDAVKHGKLTNASRSLMHANNEGFASWLRRQGFYEAATVFKAVDFVTGVVTAAVSIGKAAKKLFSVFKAQKGVINGLKYFVKSGAKNFVNTYKNGGIFKALMRGFTYAKPGDTRIISHHAAQIGKIAGSVENVLKIGSFVLNAADSHKQLQWSDCKDTIKILAKELILKPLSVSSFKAVTHKTIDVKTNMPIETTTYRHQGRFNPVDSIGISGFKAVKNFFTGLKGFSMPQISVDYVMPGGTFGGGW